ncbi:MAG: BamA/TamA family outer membrane protein [Deltaproteobacteria bacterium]|nr:BamA/TamA family outer membrane protein [Deltaproteobacteria bacterium]
MRSAALAVILAVTATAHADDASRTWKKPIVGFRVRGPTKLRESVLPYLARVRTGDLVGPADVPRLERDLLTSELFESIAVTLEDAEGGVIVVATLDDKHSWIIAPTLFFLAGKKAFGVGFAENNLDGRDQKVLLYGQIGTRDSLFYGALFDPAIRGGKWNARLDVYLYQRVVDEYANPVDDPADFDIARISTSRYFGGGALVGYNFRWWLVGDLRLRGAYVQFEDAHAPDGTPLPVPQDDGWDVSAQARLTIDARGRRFGVTWGPYLQLFVDQALPGFDDYGYTAALLRAYYSWRILDEHQLEVRTHINVGYKLPFHEELVNGGIIDLRGYALEQFRGDTRGMWRAEYSVPITKWRFLAFRAVGFYDSAYMGFNFQRGDRDYLPSQTPGASWFRSNVGGGLRVYVRNIVLPLLGFDIAYALEGKHTEVYFEVGLTDF